MDDKVFLERWSAAARDARFEVKDVRRAVWDEIEAGAASDNLAATLAFEPALALKLDCAAAVVIAAGAGIIYSLLTDLSAAYYWSMPFTGLVQGYF